MVFNKGFKSMKDKDIEAIYYTMDTMISNGTAEMNRLKLKGDDVSAMFYKGQNHGVNFMKLYMEALLKPIKNDERSESNNP